MELTKSCASGRVAISEIIRAIIEVRSAGIPVLAPIGGRAGAFGGGIITACCSRIVVSEHARVSVSGPEVIETNKRVEEFDSRDRALVWRVWGGGARYLTGGADRYVKGSIKNFREAAIALITQAPPFGLATLEAEQRRLAEPAASAIAVMRRSRRSGARRDCRSPSTSPAYRIALFCGGTNGPAGRHCVREINP